MIVLGVASFTGIYGAYANLRESVDDTYEELAFHDVLLATTPQTRAELKRLTNVVGIRDWEARLSVELPATFESDEPAVVATLLSLPATGEARIDKLRIVQGSLPPPDSRDVVLDTGFATHHALGVGAVIHFQAPSGATSVRVAGIALSPEYLWPAKTAQEHMPDVLRRWGVMWMREPALDDLAQAQGRVNQIDIATESAANPDAVIRDATRALGDDAVLRSETRERQASNVVLGLLVNAVSQMAYVLPLLFLSIVGLSTYVVLTRLVHQQRANIGLLRALGYRSRTVLEHYLAYAPLLAATGALVGFGIGYALSYPVTRIFANYVSLSDIPVKLRPDLLLLGFTMSLAFAGLASALPALAASRMRPSEAMRPPAPASGKRSLLERIAPSAPASVKLGLRNVGRNPRRAAFTMLGIALAVSVLVIPQAVIDSLNNVTDGAITRVRVADEILIFRQPVTARELSAASAHPGVATLEPLLQLQSNFERDGKQRDITIMGLEPASSLLRLADADGNRIPATTEGVILSRVFERDGIREGDAIELYDESVRVVGFTQASGTAGYVALETAQRWAGTPGASNQAMLKREPGAGKEATDEHLDNALPVAARLDVPQAIQDTKDMLRLYYAMVYIILAFGIAIGGAIVFNAVSISVLEEVRDFATLRTLGIPTRSLVAQTTTETLTLAVPGGMGGLVLGALVAKYFVGVFNSDLFVLDLHLKPFTLVVAFVAGLVVALVAEIPGVRRISRLDLAKAARERAS